MSDMTMNPNEEIDDLQADSDMDSGFAETPEPKAKDTAASITEPDKPEDTTTATATAPAAAPSPKYVRITEGELADLKASATKTAAFEGQFSKLFGTLGNVQKIVNSLQSQTPKGYAVELPDDVVAEMEADFPEIAGHIKSALGKALKGIKGTGARGAEYDPEQITALIEKATRTAQAEVLDDTHPNWRDIVGASEDAGKADQNHPFRKWLSTQDAGYQAKINGTTSAMVIARAIDKYNASMAGAALAKLTPQAKARADRIKDAVQPRGDGGQAASRSGDDADAAFEAGFNSR